MKVVKFVGEGCDTSYVPFLLFARAVVYLSSPKRFLATAFFV